MSRCNEYDPRARLLAALATLILVTLCEPVFAGTPPAPRIDAVELTGARRLSEDSILHIAGIRIGDRPDADRVNTAIKKLFATGQFDDVRINVVAGKLRLRVVERPLIANVAFEGNRAIDDKALRKAAGLEPGRPFSKSGSHDAVLRLRAAYRAKAHADTVIEVRSDTLPDNRAAVIFVIREGAAAKIVSVTFSGNTSISSRELRDVITTRVAGVFDFITGSSPYDEARLALDRERIRRHYAKRGYVDVKVEEAQSSRNPETGDWRIAFAIDEGARYRIGRVGLKPGKHVDAAAELERLIDIRPGDVWNSEAIDRTTERLTEELIGRGHVLVDVVAAPDRDPASRTMGIEFELRRRPRVLIERIEISGNAKTRDEVIRRELRFVEGDVLHALLLRRARQRLLRLGLFKTVSIETMKAKPDDRAVVAVRVEEQASSEIGFGIGYSTQEGVTGDISFTERNLLGRGQFLNVKLAASQKRAEGELSFTEPYFLGRKLAAGFDLFYRDFDNRSVSSFRGSRAGVRLRLGFDIAADTTATLNFTFARTRIYDVGADASAAIKQKVTGSPGATSDSYDTSSAGYTVAFDTRDRGRFPMSGLYIATTQDLAGFGGDARHLRTVVEARGYFPIADTVTLATRAIGGTITGYGGSDVRLVDRFFRGGETIRGFAAAGFGPRDILSGNKDALGGANFVATSAELRFGLPFMPAQLGGLSGALFADAGSLWGLGGTANAGSGVVGTSATLRASVGAGLAWNSPVGPLRVDYALPLVKQPFDKIQPLRFGLGPGF